jgi:hypothetical protein
LNSFGIQVQRIAQSFPAVPVSDDNFDIVMNIEVVGILSKEIKSCLKAIFEITAIVIVTACHAYG